MPFSNPHKYRRNLAFLAIGAMLLGGAAAYSKSTATRAETNLESGVYAYSVGDYRFEYHAPSGTECLFDTRRDPNCVTNVLRDHPLVAKDCRDRLRRELRVDSLESLRGRYRETIRRLQALGYL